MTPPLRLLAVSPDLQLGGAERVLVTSLRHLDRQRFQPVLVTFTGEGPLFDALPPDVPAETLGITRARHSVGALAKALKRHRPDVVLSNIWHATAAVLVARRLSGVPARGVAAVPFFQPPHTGARQWLAGADDAYRWSRWVYPFAEALISQSPAMSRNLQQFTRVPATRIHHVPNPVDGAAIVEKSRQTANPLRGGGPHVVAVGTLNTVKDHATLLRAFQRFHAVHGGTLTLVGGGPLAEDLRRQAAPLGDAVVFAGSQANPYPFMAGADLLALSSRFDSYPGVLVEAHALGVPCVSTDCPDGPAEIIVPGRTGLLVPVGDHEAMAGAMEQVLSPSFAFDRAAAAAVAARHDPARVVRQLEAVLTPPP